MTPREQAAREQGRIQLFLDAEEISVILTALASLRGELSLADEQLPKLTYPEVKSRIPSGLFSSLDPVIDGISKTIMSQSVADFQERGDANGENQFHETIHERWGWHGELLELMQLVLLASYSQDSDK